MYRKLLTALLMLFSFVIIALGGYQCSTRVSREEGTNKSIPIDPGRGDDGYYYPEGYGESIYDDEFDLPEKSPDRCARNQYRELAEELGAMAVFKFDKSSLEDYRLGDRLNFDVRCPRMYLDMSSSSSGSIYKGKLNISYEDSSHIQVDEFSSGFTERENKYNRWTGGASITSKSFHAIFEHTDRAIILKLDDIREVDLRDGETAYIGAGEIYYKMFRKWASDWNDVCNTKGTYIKNAGGDPIPRRDKCWLLSSGAFNCRPNGALHPRAQVTNIDITGRLRCYSRLGRFIGLNIEEAFNGLP